MVLSLWGSVICFRGCFSMKTWTRKSFIVFHSISDGSRLLKGDVKTPLESGFKKQAIFNKLISVLKMELPIGCNLVEQMKLFTLNVKRKCFWKQYLLKTLFKCLAGSNCISRRGRQVNKRLLNAHFGYFLQTWMEIRLQIFQRLPSAH